MFIKCHCSTIQFGDHSFGIVMNTLSIYFVSINVFYGGVIIFTIIFTAVLHNTRSGRTWWIKIKTSLLCSNGYFNIRMNWRFSYLSDNVSYQSMQKYSIQLCQTIQNTTLDHNHVSIFHDKFEYSQYVYYVIQHENTYT